MQTEDGFVILGWPDAVAPQRHVAHAGRSVLVPGRRLPRGSCNAQVPNLTVSAGSRPRPRARAATGSSPTTTSLTTGAVAVLLSDDVPVRPVVSQGCRPIGQPFTVTRAERNLLYELAGQPAVRRLQDLVLAADDDERELMRSGLHLGVVVDEHRLEFGRGDFLVRNLLGVDQDNGALAVGDRLEVGQTVQFQVRDATAADEDLRLLLEPVDGDAALLFTCNGRGTTLLRRARPRRGASSTTCSGRCRSPARSARARSARSAVATSCTASPRASPSSAESPARGPEVDSAR